MTNQADPQVAPEGIEQIAAEPCPQCENFRTRAIVAELELLNIRTLVEQTCSELRDAIRAVHQELQQHDQQPWIKPVLVATRGLLRYTEKLHESAILLRLPRVEGGRDIDQEPTKSVLRAEATEMTVNTAVPQPASGDSFTPAPDETVPWREGSPLCTNCGETAKPHPAYADFVGPFCDGCWDRLREYFTECPDCGRPLGGSFPKCIDCQLVDALKASE